MITTTLYMGAGLLCWYFVLTSAFARLLFLERVAFALPLGFITSGWLSLFLSSYYDGMSAGILVVIALAHLGVAAYAAARCRESLADGLAEIRLQLPQLSILVWAPLVVCYIMHTHIILPDARGNLTTGGNCYADLPFHLTVMNSFLYGKNSGPAANDYKGYMLFTLSEVIYDGHRLVYPLIPDYYSATLVVSGLSTRWAILLPSWCMAWAFFFILYFSGLRYTKSSLAALLGVYLTMFCGGNFDFSEPNYWLYFVQDIFLPQRSAMFAYSMSLAALTCLWIGIDCQSRKDPTNSERHQYYILAGVFTGLLPFLQGHAFIAVCLIGGVTLTLEHLRPRADAVVPFILAGVYFGGPALLLGLPQMTSFLGVATNGSFMAVVPMWKDGRTAALGHNMFSFFWECLGLFLYVSLVGFLALTPKQARQYVGFWVLFVITTFYKFQPWNVDNMKMYYIWYFVAAMVVGLVYDRLRKKSNVLAIGGAILLFSFMFPGLVCVVKKEMRLSYQLLSSSDLEVGMWARENTPHDSVFLIGPRHNHPIPTWGGRSVFYGYKGWLVSRSYPWNERERVVRNIITGANNALELAEQNGIDYVCLAKNVDKMENVEPNKPWLRENMNVAYEDNNWLVFELKRKRRRLQKKLFGPIYQTPKPKKR